MEDRLRGVGGAGAGRRGEEFLKEVFSDMRGVAEDMVGGRLGAERARGGRRRMGQDRRWP